MTNHGRTTVPLLQITTADMAAMIPIGMTATTETAGDLIVMMIAVVAMAHGTMIVGEEVIMAPGEMITEDTTTETTTVTALATNATTTMMMTVTAGQLLPETGIEGTWIIGIGIGMKDRGALLVRRKVGANMEGINSIAA